MPTFSLRRPAFSRLSVIIFFALYIALVLNIAFYRQAFTLLPVDSLHNALVFLSMPVVAFSVMNIVITLASFFRLDRLVIRLFVLVSAAAKYFIISFGVIIDRSMITNIVDTTPAESFALLSVRMVIVLFFSAALMIAIAWWVKVKPAVSVWRSLATRFISIVVSALLIVIVALLFYKDYASLFRNNEELVKSLSTSNSIAASLTWNSHNSMANQPLLSLA